MIYTLIFLNILLLAAGQFLWKYGLNKAGGLTIGTAARVLTSPYIWSGLGLYVIATIIWLVVLSRAKLSVVYPMQSLAYVFGVFGAWLFFHETVPINVWIGVIFIVLGITLIGVR